MKRQDELFAAELAVDMARLAERPYAEVGVPMFLLAEDLRNGAPRLVPPHADGQRAAALLREMGRARAGDDADVPAAETARLIEVLADRRLLGDDGPAFTRLSATGRTP